MIYKVICKICLFTAILIATLSAEAQTFNMSKYNNATGLPQNYVYSISQDNNGYMWIATAEGLSKYDGMHFTNYFTKDSLADDFVHKLLIDVDGNIWCGHGNGSFSIFDGKIFTKIIIPEASAPIKDMCIDDKGNIWAIEQNKGLIKISPDHSVKTFFDRKKYGRKIYSSIAAINSRTLLVGTTDGLYTVKTDNDGVPKKPVSVDEVAPTSINVIKLIADKTFFIGTDEGGIYKYTSSGDVTKLAYGSNDCQNNPACNYSIQDIVKDTDGDFYIATWGNGIKRLQIDEKNSIVTEVMTIDENNGLGNSYIKEMIIDREGIFWFATYGAGAIAWVNNYFSLYRLEDLGFQRNKVNTSVLIGSTLWMGLDNGILNLDINCMQNCAYFDARQGLPQNANITSFCHDTFEKRLLVGTESDGIFYKHDDENKFHQFNFSSTRLGQKINDIKVDANNIYIATQGGFYTYNRQKSISTLYTTVEGLPHNNINFIYIDDLGQIWLGPKDSGITLFVKNEFEVHRLSDTPINVAGIAQDNNKRLWLATYNKGVLCYADDSIITISSNEGLGKNYCYSIASDTQNRIWICHQPGLSCIDLNTGNIRIFNATNNMGAEFCNANVSTNGDIWFSSEKGVVRYMPNYDKRSAIEPILNFTSIQISGKTVPADTDIELPYPYDGKPVKFKFEFIGISFKDPQNVKYEYCLEDGKSDDEWISLGTQRHKEFDYLPDGKYTLHIRAFNSDGVLSEKQLSIKINIASPFWKTIWFPIILVIIVGLLIRFITKWRERKLMEQKRLLESEVANQTILLRRQNAVIERKNKDITDSINYAKRIQTAILPSSQSLNDFGFTDTFIYFRPRDIVSGDFYWFNRFDDTLVLCCGDCTGHGVPGAFMSMIATTIINDITRSVNIKKPSEILEEIDRELKKMLNKNQSIESQDGMDCTLLLINLKTYDIITSAARRPVYYFTNNRLNEIKGTRRSIGDHRNGNPFIDTEFKLNKGDSLYLNSDGFSDQFGGEKGDKYTATKFKQMLENMFTLTSEEQCKHLESNFIEWKGNYEQIDDVIVIGIKI